jgi:hypothetical protein
MVTKRDMIIVVLATFCLTAMIFTIMPTRSSDSHTYDPRADIDGDGRVGLSDLAILAQSWGTTGTPTNANLSNYIISYKRLQEGINNRVGSYANVMSFITPTDPLVNSMVYSITGGWSNRSDWNEYWKDVKAIWDWVRNNIQYRADGLYPILPANPSEPVTFVQDMWQFPNETLTIKKGDCEDQAMLLCSMIRCLNYQQFWVECVWIISSTSAHLGVQMPVTGNQVTILDPAGGFYTHDFWGSMNSQNVTTEINSWLDFAAKSLFGLGMGSDVHVYRIFSDYIDRTFSSTNDYLTWMYTR